MKWGKSVSVGSLVLSLLLMSSVVAQARTATSVVSVSQDVFLLGWGRGHFTVTEAVTWNQPLSHRVVVPQFTGAVLKQVVSQPSGAKIVGAQVAAPIGTRSLRMRYTLSQSGLGLAIDRVWPWRVARQIVVVKPTVRFPVILNQRFYSQPSVTLNHQRMLVYATERPLPAGTSEVFNLQRGIGAPPPRTGRQIGTNRVLIAGYLLPLAILAGVWGWKRRLGLRRHVGASAREE